MRLKISSVSNIVFWGLSGMGGGYYVITGGVLQGPHSKICRKRSSNGSTHWIFVIKLDIMIIECSLVENLPCGHMIFG